MGAKVGGSKGGPVADINVTPLVDVVLVLLIIFMVITPMLASGVDVKLPSAKTSTETQDVGQHLPIGIRDNGDGTTAIFVDTKPSSLDTVIDDINTELRDKPNRSILIKGSATLKYGEVRAVMDLVADAGITTMLLATDKKSE
jgi:biopolymer transport protein TolR